MMEESGIKNSIADYIYLIRVGKFSKSGLIIASTPKLYKAISYCGYSSFPYLLFRVLNTMRRWSCGISVLLSKSSLGKI